ncbi:MAG: hypothetical protein ABH881_03190 [bacterium]
MKITINKNELRENLATFLRSAGYGYITDRRTGNESFVRRLSREFYPRFHVYFQETDDKYIITLHLDQKKTSYAGSRMHSAEYDSELVGEEWERLKKLIVQKADRVV